MDAWFRFPTSVVSRRPLPFESEVLTEYLAFRVGDGTFALPLRDVREILVPPPLTVVPRAPIDVRGVISVRGLLVTVLDVRRKLRATPAERPERARILLVAHGGGETLGLYVDDVAHVVRFADTEIEEATGVLGGSVSECVTALGRRDGQLIVLLTLAPLLVVER